MVPVNECFFGAHGSWTRVQGVVMVILGVLAYLRAGLGGVDRRPALSCWLAAVSFSRVIGLIATVSAPTTSTPFSGASLLRRSRW